MKNIYLFSKVIFILVILTYKKVEAQDVTVWAGLGGKVDLPCPPSQFVDMDRPVLTLWFKKGYTEAVLSFDSRKTKFPEGVTWYDDIIFGGRATYNALSSPPKLSLNPVSVEDDSVFTCRTDYLKSPSSHVAVKLSVAIPPESPTILWKGQEVVSTVGPLNEGEHTELVCQTRGGSPTPTLSWWQHGRQIHGNEVVEETKDGPITKSTITLVATRSFHGTPLVCHARASHPDHSIARPQTTAVAFDIILPPLSVQINDVPDPISEHRTITPLCTSVGSHPPVNISWWKNGVRLTQVTRNVLSGGNVTTASVSLTLDKDDNGATLSCRANNPDLPTRQMIDTVRLNVFFSPQINLRIGKNLNLSNVIEGQDIFLVCDVVSNPPHHRLEWFFQGQPLAANHGAIMSATSLVLQSLKRAQAGVYSCRVTNLEGQTQSSDLELNVHYPPVCELGSEKQTQGAAVGHSSTLVCKVDANPHHSLTFRWSRPMPGGRETTLMDFNTQQLILTPSISEDFGQFYCRAINSVGTQHKPCVIILVTAGPPEPVTDCRLDSTVTGVVITCKGGFHGGFPQTFQLSAWQKNSLLFNKSSDEPNWKLENLSRSDKINFEVMAINAKGTSAPAHLQLHALVAHQQATTESSKNTGEMSLIGAIILGALVSLLILLLTALVFVQKNRILTQKRRKAQLESVKNQCSEESDDNHFASSPVRETNSHTKKNISEAGSPGETYSLSSYDSIHCTYSPTHSAPIPSSRSHASLLKSFPVNHLDTSSKLSPDHMKNSFPKVHYNSCHEMDTEDIWTNSYRRECRRKARRAALLQKKNCGSLYLGTTDGTSSAGSENTVESPLLSEGSYHSGRIQRRTSLSRKSPSCPHKNIISPSRYFDPKKVAFPIMHYSTTPRPSRASGKSAAEQIEAWKRNQPLSGGHLGNGTIKNNVVSKVSIDDQRESRV